MGNLDVSLTPVDKGNGVPLTRQIVELVHKNIEMQALEIGDRLPTERELAERLGVARGTVKSAYRQLEQQNVIQTRQGSGSFVIRDNELARKLRREKAVDIMSSAVRELTALGIGDRDISHMLEALLSQRSSRSLTIAVICDTPELLLDMKRQLSFLPGVSVTLFILESITEDSDPEGLLHSCDIILTPMGLGSKILSLLPNLAGRVTEVEVSPSAETAFHLSDLPRDARIGIISRSSSFLSAVKGHLSSCGFEEGRILSFFEMDYTTETYFPGGIDVLISFGDAHIFTNPAFTFRNEEFWAKGGKIVVFRYQIERRALISLEAKVRALTANRGTF